MSPVVPGRLSPEHAEPPTSSGAHAQSRVGVKRGMGKFRLPRGVPPGALRASVEDSDLGGAPVRRFLGQVRIFLDHALVQD